MPARIRRQKIRKMIVMGDSLSDPGNMNKSWILRLLSGLTKSGLGRFSDGLAWADLVTLKRLKRTLAGIRRKLNRKEVGVAYEKEFEWTLKKSGDKLAFGKGNQVCRNFAEGGATAAIYPATSRVLIQARRFGETRYAVYRFFRAIGRSLGDLYYFIRNPKSVGMSVFSRRLVTNLYYQRKKLKKMALTVAEKVTAVVVEWTSANDFVTANNFADVDRSDYQYDADLATEARVYNVKNLGQRGFKHFVLFNLPDLTLTPLFVRDYTEQIRQRLSNQIQTFNATLKRKIDELNADESLDIEVTLFDACEAFAKIYEQPTPQGFSKDVLDDELINNQGYQAYLKTNIANKDLVPDAFSRYMFWNELHPTSAVHNILADQFMDKMTDVGYDFSDDETMVCQALGIERPVDPDPALLPREPAPQFVRVSAV